MSNKLHYNSRCIFLPPWHASQTVNKSCLVVFFFRRLVFQAPVSPPTPLISQVQLIEFRIKIHPGVKSPIPPPLLSFICYCIYHPSPPLCHASAERIKKLRLALLQFISSSPHFTGFISAIEISGEEEERDNGPREKKGR